MPELSIRLLGPLQVALDEESVVSFWYDKVRALLAYLAVEAESPHRRETLATGIGASQLALDVLIGMAKLLQTEGETERALEPKSWRWF